VIHIERVALVLSMVSTGCVRCSFGWVPSRPSQPLWHSARLAKKRENGPETRAFRVFYFVSGLPNRQSQGANRRKSPAKPANIPVLQRLSAETGFDQDCRPHVAVKLLQSPVWGRPYWEWFIVYWRPSYAEVGCSD
jgi:hypothetical protein